MDALTLRQAEVLAHLANGIVPKVIARELGLHPQHIANVMQDIRERLHADTTAHAVAIAVRKGLIP